MHDKKIIFRQTGLCLVLLFSAIIFCNKVTAQVTAANEDFESYSSATAISSRLVALTPTGAPKPLVFSFAGTSGVNTASGIMFVGARPAGTTIFRASNQAIFFNYTTGGVIPGASSGTGQGEYRIHFSSASDTSVKSGNFKINSLYLAIGTGTAVTSITVHGFRAGKLVASGVIANLVSGSAISASSPTDLSYNETAGSNTNGNVTISFGTNWTFLDGVRFILPKDIPLSIDDMDFDQSGPTTFAPGTQALNLTPINTTGIGTSISFTPGSGDFSTVFVKAGTDPSGSPTNQTDYTASSVFGSGDQIVTNPGSINTGWYCVYDGKGSSVDVSGLAPGTSYMVKVLGYNGNTGWKTYLTTTSAANFKSFTTISVPSTQASNISVPAASITGASATINWTAGNGNKRAVFVKNTSSGTASPVFNTDYVASTSMGSGTQITSSGWYCVFNGTGTSVTVNGLTAGQAYRAMVTEYNDDGLGASYNTFNINAAVNNPVNFTMDAIPTVSTVAATGISSTGGILQGSINDNGANTTPGFEYATNSGLVSPSTLAANPSTISAGSGLTTVSGTLSGLNPSTTYYFRATGINAVGTGNGSILSFTTAPAVSSVGASNPNGYYKAGAVITVNLVFSSAVTITGTPSLALNSGGSAGYVSGSGSSSISFSYTVLSGQNSADLDYSSISALSLNGGTIRDASGNDASVILPAVGSVNSLGGQKNIVIDTQVPTLSSVSIASDNPNTALARSGDLITVTFAVNESILTPTVTIAGNAATVSNTGGNNWIATRTMSSSDVNGAVSLSIAFSDLASNAGTAVTTTTNSSSVVFDKTAPGLSSVSIASSYTNSSLARAGDLVTISFTANEGILTPTVSISGSAATVANTSGNNWTATHTVAGSDPEGATGFSISYSDLAGNAGTAVTATTNSSSVVFDKTAPGLSSVSIASSYTNSSLARAGDLVTISFTANEGILTPTVSISGSAATVANTSGNNWTATHTVAGSDPEGATGFSISYSDLAGNAGTAVTATTNSSSVVFDKTAPGLSSVSIASSNTNSSLARTGDLITVSFTANEGILTPTVTISGSAATVANTSGNNWTATRTLAGSDPEGAIGFSINYSDRSGNTGTTVTATTNSSNVVFDKTAPVLNSVGIASGYVNSSIARTGDPITISFTASEAIAMPSMTISGSAVTPTNTGGNNWIAARTVVSSDPEGITAFSISFADRAGNTGTAVTATTNSSSVVYDKTAPVLSIVGISSSNANSARAKSGDIITVSFTANESIRTPTVSINNTAATVTNTGGNSWTASRTLNGFDPEAAVGFSIIFEDLALNAGTIVTATTNSSRVVFDQSKPLLTSIVIASSNSNTAYAKTGTAVTVSFSSNESLLTPTVTVGGAAATLVNTSGNNWTATRTMTSTDAEGTVAFNIAFNDLAGNAGTAVTATHDNSKVVFDKTSPVLSTVNISSSNSANNTRAKTGDFVNILFTSAESITTPTVTIAGRNAVVTDLGANNWRARITMAGTDAEGTITFNIAFNDLAGNSGTAVTTSTNSSSVVFDKTIPTLTAVSIISNNANNAFAKTGDIITLSFTASETLGTNSVLINGRSVAATNTSGNNWTAVFTVSSTDAPGSVAFSVSFGDPAGNAGTTASSTTNGSNVTLDNVVPTVTGITRSGASPSSAAQVDFDVFFSETVFGVDISDFVLTTSGVTGASVNAVTASTNNPNIFRVSVNTGSGDGTIRLDLKNTGTGIGDAAGNMAGGYTSGQVYTISKIGPPQIQSQPNNSAICAGTNTSFAITAQSADPISYQWQVNTGTGFTNLTISGVYSNVTTTTLNITAAPATYNGYQYRCIASNSYGSTVSNTVTLTVNALPVVAAITGAAGGVCTGKTITLSNTTTGGVWSSSNVAVATITNAGVVNGVAAGSSTISYRVTDGNNCSTTITAALAVSATPTISVYPAVGFITKGSTIRLFATASSGTTIAWTPAATIDDPTSFAPNVRPLAYTSYTATVTNGQGCTASASAAIGVSDDPANAISANSAFTPNGDGINDKFVINNIDAYPVNTLQVFDKTGHLIFQATNYHNEWDGNNTSRPLTSDTYYYVFKVKDQVVKRGVLNIVVKK